MKQKTFLTIALTIALSSFCMAQNPLKAITADTVAAFIGPSFTLTGIDSASTFIPRQTITWHWQNPAGETVSYSYLRVPEGNGFINAGAKITGPQSIVQPFYQHYFTASPVQISESEQVVTTLNQPANGQRWAISSRIYPPR